MNGKNIIIQQNGTEKYFSDVWRIKPRSLTGGTETFVPVDSLELTDLTVYENGQYDPNDRGYYGFNTVTVNVEAHVSSLQGVDATTGQEYIITVDDQGNLVRTLVE